MGLIEDFSNFILEYVPSPPEWPTCNAISAISTVMGPDREVITKMPGA